ncbi:hypothetical protein FH972_008043 [Carpinus fangiana]|uniref:Uncharacterized protein n=1 Tax=Carpinus fangiana TaxID=176857 RepID=A0A5N6QXJ8_9ROSI|nr:hypothetical protein FH972_008043 [Carpinus fangiana]
MGVKRRHRTGEAVVAKDEVPADREEPEVLQLRNRLVRQFSQLAILLARTPWCCRRSPLVRLEENEEKRKRDGERWERRCAVEDGDELGRSHGKIDVDSGASQASKGAEEGVSIVVVGRLA